MTEVIKKYPGPVQGGCEMLVCEDGRIVPIDPTNTDYQNIMTLVDEGKLVIQPADGVE